VSRIFDPEFHRIVHYYETSTLTNSKWQRIQLIGIKARTLFGNSKLTASGWLAGDGFGVGSDSFYDTSANVGYQWNKASVTSRGIVPLMLTIRMVSLSMM
jgi:hypothetical protein